MNKTIRNSVIVYILLISLYYIFGGDSRYWKSFSTNSINLLVLILIYGYLVIPQNINLKNIIWIKYAVSFFAAKIVYTFILTFFKIGDPIIEISACWFGLINIISIISMIFYKYITKNRIN